MIIEVVLEALIQTLTVLGTIILFVVEIIMDGLTIILEYMIGNIMDLFVKLALGCMGLIQDEISTLLGSLGTVFYDLFIYLCTSLHTVADLVWEIL